AEGASLKALNVVWEDGRAAVEESVEIPVEQLWVELHGRVLRECADPGRHGVVEDTEATANCGLAVPGKVVCKAEARFNQHRYRIPEARRIVRIGRNHRSVVWISSARNDCADEDSREHL